MKKLNKMRFISLLLTLFLIVMMAVPTISMAAQPTVNLGTTSSFAVLANSAITNTGTTTISGNAGGDIGLSPGTSFTGNASVTTSGTIHLADAVAIKAQTDLVTAYNDAAGETPTSTIPSELGGTTLTPGIYYSADGTFQITGTLTLDAKGDPYGVFVFQTASTLITASGSNINLINSAQPCQTYWKVGSSATLGTYSHFVGHIFALASITANTGAMVQGQLLAQNGAVTLDTNIITNEIGAAPAILHVIKHVINDNGRTEVAANFNLHVKSSGIDVPGSPAPGVESPGTSYTLAAGTYVVSEDVSTGYTASYSGDSDASGKIILASGDNKTVTITNNDNILQSIAITTPATKLSYTVGDALDLTGLVVTGTNSDGSTTPEAITLADVSGFDSSAVASGQVLTITIGGQTTTYTVNVAAVNNTGWTVTKDVYSSVSDFALNASAVPTGANYYGLFAPVGTQIATFEGVNQTLRTISVAFSDPTLITVKFYKDAAGTQLVGTGTLTGTVTNGSGSGQMTVTLCADNLAADKATLAIGYGSVDSASSVTQAITLPAGPMTKGTTVTWTSSNPSVISNDGQTVNRPAWNATDATVTMTANLTNGAATGTQTFTLIVPKLAEPDADNLAADKATLAIGYGGVDSASSVTQAITLPAGPMTKGTTVTWTSSNPSVISNDGQTVNRPAWNATDATVTMTANLTNGALTGTQTFSLTVPKVTPNLADIKATVPNNTVLLGNYLFQLSDTNGLTQANVMTAMATAPKQDIYFKSYNAKWYDLNATDASHSVANLNDLTDATKAVDEATTLDSIQILKWFGAADTVQSY
ncbi:Outer membrane autotransporter barrel (modular protein) [Candidatus Desulfosporosinus infrequens]|uniref:Outer membrane autotransporter barrel (Modular protein) n=1 Tax=Candidatus Desulfosporosinus infrequens TaxID=2043169 RepID=A0A2U3LJU3_9FIRM|nr:Outer membrane autotransporter barrel (modular protein) [Candidatus Desulfosporosinus infrequens]